MLLSAACSSAGDGGRQAKGPVVLAAASQQDALEDAAGAWAAQGHARPILSFAATSALARQIEAGAPADLFISADEKWMDDVESKGLIVEGSRADFVANSLVLIAPAESQAELTIAPDFPLAAALGSGRLALADPDAVPAGRYAKQALTALGVWDSVAGKVAPAENVRVALALVARGEAPFGIVYATDAKAEPKVRVLGQFPADSHLPITYPLAVLKTSSHADAEEFRAFLISNEGVAIFMNYGFRAP
ncbi:MAG: molybdate ABC transporter substrate-binding protein [Novosphingobium sp.]